MPRPADPQLPDAYTSAAQQQLSPQVLDRWWLLYHDPELERLIEQALGESFDAREALARLEEARAIRASALSGFAPQGALEGSGETSSTTILHEESESDVPSTSSSTEGKTRSANLSFNVSWELDLFGRRRAAARTADADLAAARFNYEATRAALAADVAESLFEARGFALQLEDAVETLRIQQQLLEAVRIRVARGLDAASDAARVEVDLAQAQAQQLRLDAQLRAARRALLLLTGRGGEELDALPVTSQIAVAPAAPAVLPGDLLARRPDVREAQARLESAAGQLTTAKLELFPRFDLLPGVGLSALDQEGVLEQRTSFWSLGLGVSVPILDRPRLHAQIREQSARTEQAVLAYERAVQTAFSETDQALLQLAANRERSQILIRGETHGRKAYDAALIRYRVGIADLQTLLDAESAWRTARTAATTAQVELLQSSVDVFLAAGGGWSPGSMQEDSIRQDSTQQDSTREGRSG